MGGFLFFLARMRGGCRCRFDGGSWRFSFFFFAHRRPGQGSWSRSPPVLFEGLAFPSLFLPWQEQDHPPALLFCAGRFFFFSCARNPHRPTFFPRRIYGCSWARSLALFPYPQAGTRRRARPVPFFFFFFFFLPAGGGGGRTFPCLAEMAEEIPFFFPLSGTAEPRLLVFSHRRRFSFPPTHRAGSPPSWAPALKLVNCSAPFFPFFFPLAAGFPGQAFSPSIRPLHLPSRKKPRNLLSRKNSLKGAFSLPEGWD